jgi:hypothetical protein
MHICCCGWFIYEYWIIFKVQQKSYDAFTKNMKIILRLGYLLSEIVIAFLLNFENNPVFVDKPATATYVHLPGTGSDKSAPKSFLLSLSRGSSLAAAIPVPQNVLGSTQGQAEAGGAGGSGSSQGSKGNAPKRPAAEAQGAQGSKRLKGATAATGQTGQTGAGGTPQPGATGATTATTAGAGGSPQQPQQAGGGSSGGPSQAATSSQAAAKTTPQQQLQHLQEQQLQQL